MYCGTNQTIPGIIIVLRNIEISALRNGTSSRARPYAASASIVSTSTVPTVDTISELKIQRMIGTSRSPPFSASM